MQRNTQPAEKSSKDDGSILAVNSIFYTIQGEGPFAGCPAVFVRLAGCNLQCPMCDTEYFNRTFRTPQAITEAVAVAFGGKTKSNLVVLTGGEPFRQDIDNLVCELLANGFKVQIETNGTLFRHLTAFGDENLTIVCSPKAGAINKKLAPHIAALKYVATVDSLENSLDGLPTHALEHPNGGMLARPPKEFKGPIYLQPVDEQDGEVNERNLAAVVKSCMDYGYRLCLQVHKIIGVD